ncbi:MAG: hypothetical protein PHE24_06925, partial [Patescibacteria group bacterium]|nr:hypothetical protein [Patescibacteria group bacterium]
MEESIFPKSKIKQQGKNTGAAWLAGVLFLLAIPLAAQASIYNPGQTLNPDCPPTESTSTCGVIAPASAGSNSNITSLHGLTTPLSIGQGGTGLSAAGLNGQALMSSGGALTWTTLDTSVVPENGVFYFTDARARSAISSTIAGLTYTSGTGVFSINSGYEITQTASSSQWNTLYHNPSAVFSASGNLAWTGKSIGVAANYEIPLSASTTQWNGFKPYISLVPSAASSSQWNSWKNTLPATASTTQWNSWKPSIAIIPAAASSTQWNLFYHSPSAIIATSGNLQWAGNTLGVMPDYSIPLAASTSDWNTLKHNQITLNSFSSSLVGLTYNNTTGVFSATPDYEMSLNASTSQWNSFYQNPSSRIQAGINCSWSGNTFDCNGGSGTSSPPAYTAGGTLLQLQGTEFSVKEGTLNHNKGCVYVAGTGLVCNSDFIGLSSLSSAATGLNYSSSTGQFSWNGDYSLPLAASTTQWNTLAHASSSYLSLNALSSTATGLNYNNTTGEFSWDSGYGGYLTASGTNWQTFYLTPSARIAAANNLAWTENTLGVAADYEIPLSASTTQWNALAHNTTIPSTASTTQWNTYYHNPSSVISAADNLIWNENTLGVAADYEIPLSASTTQWNSWKPSIANIPIAASTTQWNTYYHNPSAVISAGANCSWDGNTFNCTSPGSGNWNASGTDSWQNGKVGIGKDSPKYALDINGDINYSGNL